MILLTLAEGRNATRPLVLATEPRSLNVLNVVISTHLPNCPLEKTWRLMRTKRETGLLAIPSQVSDQDVKICREILK